ncbi:MAG: DsrE/DsrF-like family protein [Methanobacterium sp. PtaB.Bin024]|jgi:tRNA 2-thiouridine synthesizing protein D|nr:MAG: DsrE/DsrF-like family protein [Methanobacterium sp. PtaB.Bin024]
MTTHLNENTSNKDTMVIVFLDGPYISQYADIGYKMAESALDLGYGVKIFLYIDGVHIPQKDQNPRDFPSVSLNFEKLIKNGCEIKACVRCATARGYTDESHYLERVEITSVYDLAAWMDEDCKVIILGS